MSSIQSSKIIRRDRDHEKKGLPKYSSFLQTRDTAINLFNESKFNYEQVPYIKIRETQKQLILLPSINQDAIDKHFYISSALLSKVHLLTSKNFDDNNIKIPKLSSDEKSFFETNISKNVFLKLINNEPMDDSTIEDFLLSSADQMIQGIETSFQKIRNSFDSLENKYSEFKPLIKEERKKIRNYAKFGKEITDIIRGYNLVTEAGLLNSVFDQFDDKIILADAIKFDKIGKYYLPMINTQAHLRGLGFTGSIWNYTQKTGEEVDINMRIAKIVKKSFALEIENDLTKERKIFFELEGARFQENKNYHKEFVADDIANSVSKEVLQDEIIQKLLEFSPFQFYDIQYILNDFGIPPTVGNTIEYKLLNSDRKRIAPNTKRINIKDALSAVKTKNSNYISGVSKLVSMITGTKLKPISYRFFGPEDHLDESVNIRTMHTVTKPNKGNVKRISDGWNILTPENAIEVYKKLFPKADLYVGRNTAVCIPISISKSLEYINPKFSVVETSMGERVPSSNPIAADIERVQIDGHELTHVAQIGTPVIWRGIGVTASQICCNIALQNIETGVHDISLHEFPVSWINRGSIKYSEFLVNTLKEYATQSFMNGKEGEKIRDKGFFQYLHEKKLAKFDAKVFDYEVLKELELEDSISHNYCKRVQEAIIRGDKEELTHLANEGKIIEEDLNIVTETMAETFGLEVIKLYAERHPNRKEFGELLDFYVAGRESGLKRLGEHAVIYMDALKNSSSKKEFEETLLANGLVYQRSINKHEIVAPQVLTMLGYNELDPFLAYADMNELARRANEVEIPFESTLRPYNSARVITDIRYRTNIPLFQKVVETVGTVDGFDKLSKTENIAQVEQLLK